MNLVLKRMALTATLSLLTMAGAACAQETTTPPSAAAQTDGAPPPSPEGGPRRGGPEHRVEMLQRALDLTPDQTAQVRSLFGAERSKMEALRSNTSLAQADRHAQMMAIHQDTQTRMHALLTPEQAAKYDVLESRMRDRRNGGDMPPPPPPSTPDR